MMAFGNSKPLFVLGCPRSGTTLLAGMLNRLNGVHITRETGFVADLYRPNMHQLTAWPRQKLDRLMDQVWSYLVRHGWNNRPTAAGFFAFADEAGCHDYSVLVRYCWQLEESIDSQSLNFLGDNTPRYTLAIPLLHRLFPEARYINLVRDGRDVVCSLVNRHFGANSLLCAARSWMDHVGCWQMAERIIPVENRLELRYEDLVTDFPTARQRLNTFLSTTVNDDGHTFDAHGLADHMSHHSRLNSPLNSDSIGRFQTELGIRQINDIEAVMYSGLVAYGYEVGPFRPSAVMQDRSVLLTGSHVLDLMKRAMRKVQPCP
jgi:hypothetical protein